jgi:hypothetical protein
LPGWSIDIASTWSVGLIFICTTPTGATAATPGDGRGTPGLGAQVRHRHLDPGVASQRQRDQPDQHRYEQWRDRGHTDGQNVAGQHQERESAVAVLVQRAGEHRDATAQAQYGEQPPGQ